MGSTIEFIGYVRFDSNKLKEEIESYFDNSLSNKCINLNIMYWNKSLWYIDKQKLVPLNNKLDISINEYIDYLIEILIHINKFFPEIPIFPSIINYKYSEPNYDGGGTIKINPILGIVKHTIEEFINCDWVTTIKTIRYKF